MYNIVNLGFLYQGRIKSKREMCPKNTDAPPEKLTRKCLTPENTILDADGDGRTNGQG